VECLVGEETASRADGLYRIGFQGCAFQLDVTMFPFRELRFVTYESFCWFVEYLPN